MSFVVTSGSKQYLVQYGQQIIVDNLSVEPDTIVDLPVLFSLDPATKATSLQAKVLRNQKGNKIRVVKFKSKSNYHRQYGYRHAETVLEILDPKAKSTTKGQTSKNQDQQSDK